MSIPTRAEAAQILSGLAPSERLLAHCSAVAEIAAFLAATLARRGVAVNGPLADVAALLHDIDKALPADDSHRALGHGAGGAAWLREHGFEELATPVAMHPVTTLGAAVSYEEWSEHAALDGRVVAYADKRATQDLVTLDARFDRWDRRYPGSESLRVARERAKRLEREICDAAGIGPEDVARVPWVSDAMRRAA